MYRPVAAWHRYRKITIEFFVKFYKGRIGSRKSRTPV